MHFTRLRLSGFKSFVDPTELVIEPGLTGVVGPNGCGKSNLLEALRWVMGENSAKSMRGSGMDDVIFAGTTSRPARNLAEVTLTLDNDDRTAPAAFNDEALLEISRRIERESGSAYRLNGKDVRGKDVKLLFADASTGAHSPSLVSQGRIGALVNAKPSERRALLEEAAGISGLHSRRKEAESKLRSAEGNLERLGDVEIQLQEQIRGLKNQARQATRYKNVSGEIRRLMALILYLEWRALAENMAGSESNAREMDLAVARITTQLGSLNKEQAILASKMPELRQNEAELAAKLHRMTVSRDGLDGEEQRLTETQEKLTALLEQIVEDEGREKNTARDTARALEQLGEEKRLLLAQIEGESGNVEALAEILSEKQAATLESEWALEELTQKQAQRNAERTNLLTNREQTEIRLTQLGEQKTAIEDRLIKLESNNLFTRALSDCENRLRMADADLVTFREKTVAAEDARELIQQKDQDMRDNLHNYETRFARVRAEKDALEELLSSGMEEAFTPLLEQLSVTQGYEVALGAALDADLNASDDEAAPMHWRDLPPLKDTPPLPYGVPSLDQFVKAPTRLSRRLSQIGIVDNEQDALRLMGELKVGQRLVTRGGGLWRWDGFAASAEAPTGAAIRLAQKNRLEKLVQDHDREQAETGNARALLHEVQEEMDVLKQAALAARESWQRGEEKAAHARRDLTEAEQQSTRHQSEESALKDRLGHLIEETQEVRTRHNHAVQGLGQIPESAELELDIQNNRELVEIRRGELSKARIAHDSFRSQSDARSGRLGQIETEQGGWKARVENIEDHLGKLIARRTSAQNELKSLENRPGEIVEERRKLNVMIDEAEMERREAAKILGEAEEALATKDREIREIQGALSEAREQKARLETSLEQYEEQKGHLLRRIEEEFDCTPDGLHGLAEIGEEEPDEDAARHKLERLKSERERLGVVNLRAEIELNEIEEQLGKSISEREELQEAITRLRKAISDLNREGRARLLKAFEKVNTHFSELFTTLFGGGEAHLELTESDDPLEAGLEIMASPPGKKMQNLGLLSGGEQALTALSLIFAVFMTNPAPICVLDEVDAPLDDANVERFCDLLDEMRDRTSTRFLIVTHNALTMSRMSRLFGVTMAERGVSQLVSVDLESAEKMRDRVPEGELATA